MYKYVIFELKAEHQEWANPTRRADTASRISTSMFLNVGLAFGTEPGMKFDIAYFCAAFSLSPASPRCRVLSNHQIDAENDNNGSSSSKDYHSYQSHSDTASVSESRSKTMADVVPDNYVLGVVGS